MRIAVCCKAVVTNATAESVQAVNESLISDSSDVYINELDDYALEAALAIKKAYNAETWAYTVGSLRSQEALYMALAKGIDKVARINSDVTSPELIAKALTDALAKLNPQIILTGVQSEDWMGGEIGPYIAEGLGASLGFAVVDIPEITETHVRVIKEIGGGRKIETLLKLPAVLCIQSGIKPLQYVSAMRRRKVTNTEIESAGNVANMEIPDKIKNMLNYHLLKVETPEMGNQAILISGDKTEKAKKILEIFKTNLSA